MKQLVRVRRRVRQAGAAGERSVAMLGRQGWLDRPSYRLEHTLGLALAACGRTGERVSNLLHGTWLGHPLHPLLTTFPTGAIASTMVLDAVDAVAGDSHGAGTRGASRLTLGLGIVGSLGAAATGVNDWQHTHEQSRRVGLVHGALNVAATGLYVLSWLHRGRGRHTRGVAASALGYGITLTSGYLGASLVYRFGIGVDQSGPLLANPDWTPLLAEDELNLGEARRCEVAGIGIVLLREAQDILAVGEHCPHLGAPMSDGWVDGGRIVCPWHGSRFQAGTGAVLRGPATAPLPCYQTRLREGFIEVRGNPPTSVPASGAEQ